MDLFYSFPSVIKFLWQEVSYLLREEEEGSFKPC